MYLRALSLPAMGLRIRTVLIYSGLCARALFSIRLGLTSQCSSGVLHCVRQHPVRPFVKARGYVDHMHVLCSATSGDNVPLLMRLHISACLGRLRVARDEGRVINMLACFLTCQFASSPWFGMFARCVCVLVYTLRTL